MSLSIVPRETLDAMVQIARGCPNADFAEVGVYQGGSAYDLSKVTREKGVGLWLYDTFTGMPYSDPGDLHQIGDFADTSVARVRQLVPNAIICPGTFPHSLVYRPPLGFVHCDVDQYAATKAVIEHLWPLLVPGGVMWFDDCELLSARRAIEESLDRIPALYPAPCGRFYAVKA